MRILVASDQWFPHYPGGAARFAAEQAACLAAAGHEVHVLAPAGSNPLPPLHLAGTIRRGGLPRTIVDPLATFLPARLARGRRFDVVVAHQATTAYGCKRALPDTPLVFVFHASAAREARLRAVGGDAVARAKAAGFAKLLDLLERRVVDSAVAVVPLSEYSGGLLRHDHPSAHPKLTQMTGAVDTTFFCPADPDVLATPPLLLIVRRLEEGLGIEQAFEAIAQLTREAPLEVKFAGDGPAAGRLKTLASQLGLGETITFLGNVPSVELVQCYRRSHAVLIPPAPHEGFGLAALEALACSRPAVGLGGALSRLLGDLDESLVAADSSPAALAEAVRRALDLAHDAAFRRRCRAYAQEGFSWSAAAPHWTTLLRDAVGGSA